MGEGRGDINNKKKKRKKRKKKKSKGEIRREMTMALSLDDIKNLIQIAQGKDEVAADVALTDLLIEIVNNHMDRHLSKYIRKNTIGDMDADDIRQIFLIGCSKAIREANPHVGNPLLFILQKGKWAVVDALRKQYRTNLRQYCHKCGSETRLHEQSGQAICPKCQSADGVDRIPTNVLDDGTLVDMVIDERLGVDEKVISKIIIERFRSRLTGRKAEIFDLMIYHGYDRESCQNYIKEIAAILGVTPANVNLRLRQVKEEWAKYLEEIASGIDE